jgi:hypothetical protein
MANELKLNISGELAKDQLRDQIHAENLSLTQNLAALISKTVSVSHTSESDLDTTGITTLGYAFIKNLGPTNYLTYGPKNTSNVMEPFGRLKVGEVAVLRLEPGKVLRWKADTGTITAFVKIYND